MLLIIVILLVNFILIPLIELTLSERIKFFAEVTVYAVTFIFVVYTLWTGKVVI
jgi:hypothetical protein